MTVVNGPTIIISPELPPTPGGLGDYVAKVVAQWPRIDDLKFVIPQPRDGRAESLQGYPVDVIAPDADALLAKLPMNGGNVLLQYSGYGFSAHGYPAWLARALLDWRKRCGGRLVIMFHEIWTFSPWWNKNFLLQQLHRRAIGTLVRVADSVFTSTASQAEHLTAFGPPSAIRVLPVGSNIDPGAGTSARALQRGTAVVFGLQATRVRALRALCEQLRELARAERVTKIIALGAGNSPSGDVAERQVLGDLRLRDAFEQVGAASEAEISDALSTAELGISAQDPLSYTKSGTFMAYAAHGLCMLSDYADASQPNPMSLLVKPEELLSGITDAELDRRRLKVREWYNESASWPRIAGVLFDALDLASTKPAARP
jgi:hypothetical protein